MTENDKAILKALEEVENFYKPEPQYFPIFIVLVFICVGIYFLTN